MRGSYCFFLSDFDYLKTDKKRKEFNDNNNKE